MPNLTDALMKELKRLCPNEARADSTHEFWGPSPDVRARNFADPGRHVVNLLEQAGEQEALTKAWHKANADRKQETAKAWRALSPEEKLGRRAGVTRALRTGVVRGSPARIVMPEPK